MIFYRIAIRCYGWALWIASFFHPKARAWVNGRKGWKQNLAAWRNQYPKDKLCWMHCASLGEFEQGRPVLEALRKEHPNCKIVLSFFSPSGYEIRKNYEGADYVCYLPLDTVGNARAFVTSLQPNLAIFVKYEFWYFHLKELFKTQVPTILISALFRDNQIFFRSYGRPFLQLLKGFSQLFVQDEASIGLLAERGVRAVQLAGDTRVDRSMALPSTSFSDPIIKAFAKDEDVLVVGSSWPPDEQIIFDWALKDEASDWKILLAPHDIGKTHIERIMETAPVPILRYTKANPEVAKFAHFLLLDTIGMLSKVYRYGKVAYIGGGFGAGIHNTLEPIAYKLPVFFGPKFKKFQEAKYLHQKGGGFTISSAKEFQDKMALLSDPSIYQKTAKTAYAYIQDNKGATAIIMDHLSAKAYLA